MRYFTPELLARFCSKDDNVSAPAHDDWDRAIDRYHRRLDKILPSLPKGVRRFRQERVCLHDAEILSMGRRRNAFLLLLETEPPDCKLVVLTLTLTEEPVIRTGTRNDSSRTGPIYWLYEEWDLDRRKRPTFEVLLSNGWELKLHFRELLYQIAEPVLERGNGEVSQAPVQLVSG